MHRPSFHVLNLLLAFVFASSSAFAQSAEDVRRDILSALSSPLPITVIGPVIAQDVEVAATADGFRATLKQPTLMGIIPLDRMAFDIGPGDIPETYRISNLELPEQLQLFGQADLALGKTDFSGIWSVRSRSYLSLKFGLNDIAIKPKNQANGSVTVKSLTLDVDKEGIADATESRFVLTLDGLESRGMPADDISLRKLTAQLKADGEQPVDLYAVISRFTLISLMQQDQSALLAFAESLRNHNYTSVSLRLDGEGLNVVEQGVARPRIMRAQTINGALGFTGMTPQEWQGAVVSMGADAVRVERYSPSHDMALQSGTLAFEGKEIPIGAALKAISSLQALEDGRPVSMRAVDLLDGFLNFQKLAFRSDIAGAAIVPSNKEQPGFALGRLSTETALEGFRQRKGSIRFAVDAANADFDPGNIFDGANARILKTLNPRTLRYNLTISDLNEDLLYKLARDVTIDAQQDGTALAAPALVYAMALKPMIETVDMRFVSDEIDMRGDTSIRFFPAWVLQGMPYEGVSSLKLKGLDNLQNLLTDLKKEISPEASRVTTQLEVLTVSQSIISTFRALSIEQDGALVWNLEYPDADRALFKINDVELRFPNIGAYLPVIGLSAAFAR